MININHKYRKYFIFISIFILIISQFACKIEKLDESIPNTPTNIPTIIPTITKQIIIPTLDLDLSYAIVANCEYLNLRMESNESSQIITTIPAGDKVLILDESENGWYQVNWMVSDISGFVGWVNGEYLSFETSQ